MLNPIKYVKKLETAGFTRDQAEAHVEILGEFLEDTFATKREMAGEFLAVRSEMKTEFAAVRAEMKSEFGAVRAEMKTEFAKVRSEMAELRTDLQADMRQLESRLTIKLGGIVSVVMAITVALVKLVL